jgi:hypothetical protein
MELMRHTDIRLTAKVYTDPRLLDMAGAVEKLSIPDPQRDQAAVATGTTGAVDQTPMVMGPKSSTKKPAGIVSASAAIGSNVNLPSEPISLQTRGNVHESAVTESNRLQCGETPQVGLEPTTRRLTADCSTIELLRKMHPLGADRYSTFRLVGVKD